MLSNRNLTATQAQLTLSATFSYIMNLNLFHVSMTALFMQSHWVRHFLIFLAPNKLTNGLTEVSSFSGNIISIDIIFITVIIIIIINIADIVEERQKRTGSFGKVVAKVRDKEARIKAETPSLTF